MRTRTLWCGVAQNVPPSAGATAPGRDVSARFLWDPLRRRVVSADAGALALFGEARLLDLLRRPFPAGERLGDALAAAADRLRPGGSAEETLTIPGEQIAAVAASLRAAPLPDGRMGLDICVIGGAAPVLGGEIALAAAAADALSLPLLIVDAQGGRVYANDAADALYVAEGGLALNDITGSDYAAQGIIARTLGAGHAARTLTLVTRAGPRATRVTARRIAHPETGDALIALMLDDIADEARLDADTALPVQVPAPAPAVFAPSPAPFVPAPTPPAPARDVLDLDDWPQPALIANADGTIRALNQAARALHPGLIIGASFGAVLDPAIAGDVAEFLKSGAQGLSRSLMEGRETVIVSGEEARPFFLTLRPRGATPGETLAVLQDLAPEQQRMASMRTEREEAELASRRKSAFIAAISHELRTPLNAIRGFAEVMRDERFGPIGNTKYADYVRDIHASSELVLSLVNELLDLSKAEAGRMELTFEGVDVADVAAQAVRLVAPLAERAGVELKTQIEKPLPKVVADRRSVMQVLLNLTANAIKYNKSGGEAVVSVHTGEDGSLILSVSDTGAGMSEADVAQALEPFGRAKSAKNGREGTGLGLPLAKALAEANRAEFAIDSTPGQGTQVRVVFPSPLVLAE